MFDIILATVHGEVREMLWEDTSIPSLTGKPYTEAEKVLTNHGYRDVSHIPERVSLISPKLTITMKERKDSEIHYWTYPL